MKDQENDLGECRITGTALAHKPNKYLAQWDEKFAE